MNPRLLKSIKDKKSALDHLRPFPNSALERLHDRFVVEWTYNSNAIEGSTLTLKETALILNEGLTISGKPLREHFEAVNHKEAIQQIEQIIQTKSALTESTILNLHKIILKGIDESAAGVYRKLPVRILGADHIPPNAVKVPQLMSECLQWFNHSRKKLHPVEQAALIHFKLVNIHPFIDGNGRTARLIMNLILMQAGFPPAVILKVDRRKYYRVLKEADHGIFDSYLNFIARSIERSLIIYLHALTPSKKNDEKQGYISLTEAAQGSPYSQEYLSLLARRGILPAVKFGRNWMTTRDAIRDHISAQKK